MSGNSAPRHTLPGDIERTSLAIIAEELAARGLTLPPENGAVVRRVIHATADFDYAANLRFTPGAAAAGARPLLYRRMAAAASRIRAARMRSRFFIIFIGVFQQASGQAVRTSAILSV